MPTKNETVLAAKDFLDGELAKYDTLNRDDKSITLIVTDESNFQQLKKNGVGRETILKFLGGNWTQYTVRTDQMETKVLEPKKRICANCGTKFEVTETRGGRLSCSPECSHAGKLRKTQIGARKFQNGLLPICQKCGTELDPPGPCGGRPRAWCRLCRPYRYKATQAAGSPKSPCLAP